MYDVASRSVSILLSLRSTGSVGMSCRKWWKAPFTLCVRPRSLSLADEASGGVDFYICNTVVGDVTVVVVALSVKIQNTGNSFLLLNVK